VSQENNKEANCDKIFYLYSCGRDGSFKKFTVEENQNSNNNNALNLKEKDFSLRLKETKNYYSLTSLEDFFIIEERTDDPNKTELSNKFSENVYFAGHHGRDLCFYDMKNNLNFYSKEIKGVHRPFDIIMKDEESKLNSNVNFSIEIYTIICLFNFKNY